MDFGFEIVRLWQRPAEALLSGSVATLPLAPLGQLPAGSSPGEALPAIIRRIEERLSQDATPEAAAKLMRATFVLTGMVVAKATLQNLFAESVLCKSHPLTTCWWRREKSRRCAKRFCGKAGNGSNQSMNRSRHL